MGHPISTPPKQRWNKRVQYSPHQMMVESYRAGNLVSRGMLRSIQGWIAYGVVPFRMTENKPMSNLWENTFCSS
jgi:hypothetical protein